MTISNISFTFRAWFQRRISQEKMSKVKDKAMEEEKKEEAMEEEKKEMGEADTEKGEREGKNKRLPKPGSPGNPFRCGQGLKCPWVNGEKGPR